MQASLPSKKQITEMKKVLKKRLAVVATLTFATLTLAFTERAVLQEETWFYTSTDMSQEALNNPENYSSEPVPGVNCGGNLTLCSINDQPHPDNPELPAISKGDVAQNEIAYQATRRQ